MTMFGTVYVVDTNTLVQLRAAGRASAYFLEHAKIPEAVLYEARNFPDHDALSKLRYATTSGVLRQLSRVMVEVEPGDVRLVDLYRNQGGADPLVIACALDGQDGDSQQLGSAEWIVVTNDEAVRALAHRFEIEVLSNAEFGSRIDEAS